MPRQPMPDVVVLLPGILGSVLQRDGRDVWGATAGGVFRALMSLGGSVKSLELSGDDPDLDDLGDGVTATRLAPDLHLIPGFWKIDGYGKLSSWVREQFDVTEGQNFFTFPYDWRRDNRVAARKLARASHGWLRDWRARSGNDDAKLILVGHSMGGLVSRAFCELMDGWRDTRMLITFGTPYRGSLNALSFLSNGFRKGIGPLSIDLTDLLRSLTSVYQLLPIYECYDAGGGQLVRVGETDGIPGVDPARAAAALSFHHAIRDAVTRNQQDDAYVERGYSVRPVVGIDQPTLQSARLAGGVVRLERRHGDRDLGGDGTVPRVSALPLEMTDARDGTFSSEIHGSLQNAGAVLTHLSGLLTGTTVNLRAFESIIPPRLGLDVDDAYGADEPVLVRGRAADQGLRLHAVVTAAESGGDLRPLALTGRDGEWRTGELPPLPPGLYRVTLGAPGIPETVTDVFAVFSTEP